MSAGDIIVFVVIAAVVVVILAAMAVSHLGAVRRARVQLGASDQYRELADEFRRLSDVSITAQEHVDFRLTDLGVQLDALREQLDRMQRILNEVE
ncbi:MAG: hypothetical protein JO016_02565 [Actinobacteria bacterium]|nr:hypothetical protein [Actinomycetota bacterium]